MSTAVLEKPLTPKEQANADLRARADAFEMPKPTKGSAVLWYPHGQKSESPETGFILKIGHRNLVVMLGSGVAKETVRHIDDPKLLMGVSQRENGAWDFTDEAKLLRELNNITAAQSAKIAALQEQVSALEDLVGGGKKKKAE